jgi:hypothetical protein
MHTTLSYILRQQAQNLLVAVSSGHREGFPTRKRKMNDPTAEIEGIPDAARELWNRLMAEKLVPVHELFKQVRDYQQTIAQRAEWQDSDVDPKLARALADTSLKLLGTLEAQTPEDHRRLVQAAVRYFVIEDDADSDLDSILGLDDDAEVLNAVLRHLGLETWTVEVP